MFACAVNNNGICRNGYRCSNGNDLSVANDHGGIGQGVLCILDNCCIFKGIGCFPFVCHTIYRKGGLGEKGDTEAS